MMNRQQVPDEHTHALEGQGISASRIAMNLNAVTYLYPKYLSKRPARGIREITLSLELGKIYGLLGANGSGKSTLLKVLAGELYPQQGQIYLFEQDCSYLPMWKRARRGLLYLNQKNSLAEQMTVKWNLDLAIKASKAWSLSQSSSTHPQSLSQTTEQMGIAHLLAQKVSTLSGGEKRRVELARVMLRQPQVVILDEPFAALDQQGIEATLAMIKALKDLGALVLLTDHQNKYIEMVAQQRFFLDEGKLSFI